MKKLLTIVLSCCLFACLPACKKTLNRNITLNKIDKNPYGAWYAYEQLDWIFPLATVLVNTESPALINNGNWDLYRERRALPLRTNFRREKPVRVCWPLNFKSGVPVLWPRPARRNPAGTA